MRALATFVLLLVAGSVGASTAGSTAQVAAGAHCWDGAVLLDPEQDDAVRAGHLGPLQAAAADGDPQAQYVLGTLYRLGRAHPARLVDKDLDRASRLLAHAALAGHRLAMAGQAEAELEAGRPLAGMMWAQGFVRHAELFGSEPESGLGEAYPAWLVKRHWDALRREGTGAQLVEETFNGFVRQYAERIRAAVAAGPQASSCPDRQQPPLEFVRDGGGTLAGSGLHRQVRDRPEQPGMALYLVGVSPDGSLAKILVMDSLPGADMAEGLLANLRRARFNAVAADAPLRWAQVPVHFDDGSIGLRHEDGEEDGAR